MIQSPCKECTARALGCHGTCESYKTFQGKLEEEKENIRKQKHALYSLPNQAYKNINLRGR